MKAAICEQSKHCCELGGFIEACRHGSVISSAKREKSCGKAREIYKSAGAGFLSRCAPSK